jgi:hypothetical protein
MKILTAMILLLLGAESPAVACVRPFLPLISRNVSAAVDVVRALACKGHTA